jgi:hypothetical protein
VTKAIKVMRLKTDRRGGVAFPGSEEVFIEAPCDVERRCQSARRLFAAFVEGVKICKACSEGWRERQAQANHGPGPVAGILRYVDLSSNLQLLNLTSVWKGAVALFAGSLREHTQILQERGEVYRRPRFLVF